MSLLISIDRARFNVPPNTLYVISGTGFYGSNDPTNSVKARNEDRIVRIRLQSHHDLKPLVTKHKKTNNHNQKLTAECRGEESCSSSSQSTIYLFLKSLFLACQVLPVLRPSSSHLRPTDVNF